MQLPISINDIIILTALTSLILLITSELLNPRNVKTNIVILKKRISKIAIINSILFLFLVLIKIYEIINQ